MSPHGQYMDKRDPDRAYNSRIKETEAITGFIKTLIGDKDSGLTKLVTEKIQADAKEAAGSFIAEQGIESVPEANQPRWRELSPLAQGYVQQERAQYATRMAGELYNAEVTANPILTQPSEGNPELQARQAEARASALATAREKSGLSTVSPYLQMQNAPQLTQYTAAVDGAIYKQRSKNADDQRQNEEVNKISSDIEEFESKAAVFGSTNERVAGLRALLERKAQVLGEFYTTKQISQMLGRAIAEQLPGIIQSKDDLNLTLADLEALTTQEILVNGENIWDVPGEKGKSLRLRLNETLQAAGTLKDSRNQGLAIQKAIQQLRSGDPQGAISTIEEWALNVTNTENVKLITQAFSALGSSKGLLKDAQNGAALDFWNRNVNGETWKSMWPEIFEGGKNETLSARFVEAIGKEIQAGENGTANGQTQRQINTSLNQLNTNGRLAVSLRRLTEGVSKRFAGNVPQAILDNLKLALPGRYATLVEQKRADDPKYDVFANADADLKEAEKSLLSEIAERKQTEVYSLAGGAARAVQTLNTFQKNLKATGGQLTVDVFPDDVKTLAKEIYKDQEIGVEELTATMISLLANSQYEGGDAVLGDREAVKKVLTDTVKRLQQRKPISRELPPGQLPGRNDILKTVPVAQTADRIIKNAGLTPEEDGSNAKEVGRTLTDANLRSLALSRDPEAPILNEESMGALASAWKGSPVPLSTALPQLDPATETEVIPTYFGAQNSRLFIAIGLNEGTRTADGSYTKAWYGHRDAGDKNWNRGTVSGGRGNNLKPIQVDRQWRGILAQTATDAKKWLRAMGLKPGTVGYNNVMFSVVDLKVQAAPAALPSFIQNLMGRKDFTLEGIARARADAFINPKTGRLETTFASYNDLLRDQRSRAGTLQFGRRI